jgi:PAS domain S-box-containing protein
VRAGTLGDSLVPGIALLSIFVAELIIYVSGDLFLLVLTNLFYLGVVLGACFLPDQGLRLSVGFGAAYFLLRFFLGDVVPFDALTVAMQSLVICSTGTIASHVTWKLTKEEQKFRTIFEEAETGIVLVDRQERIADMNSAGATIVGMDRNALIGVDVDRLFEKLSICGDLMPTLRDHGTVTRFQARFRRPDGSWGWLMLNGRCLEHGLILLTFFDITDQMREHDELRHLHEEEHLLLDIITHDINNVNLAAIGYAELIRMSDDETDDENEEALIRTVQKSIEIIRNVNTLRRLHEREALDIRPVNLDPLIRDEIVAHPDVTILYERSGVCIWADTLLSEVFTNLIGNSVKFGGPDVTIAIRAVEKEGTVSVFIADDGPGIPESRRSSLFFRYSRSVGRKTGRGLGLYIVRILMERYGGGIRIVDSESGVGAAFELTFRNASLECENPEATVTASALY